ncbi:MAG: O-antigen ligase family protein [Lachnospiraceae bacterium]|nr:O-antigen ligase family protein [Lachnospiraceae bacterium]
MKKSTAIQAVILIAGLLLLLSVYPARVYQQTETAYAQGEIADISEAVTRDDTFIQKFTTQYDFIRSVTVYIDEVTLGRYIGLNVLDPAYQIVTQRFYDLEEETIPGYVTLPLNLAVKPGEQYLLMFRGLYSTLRLGYSATGEETSPYIHEVYYHDTTVEQRTFAGHITYELPVSKSDSLGIMAAIVVLALVSCAVVRMRFGLPVLPWRAPPAEHTGPLKIDPPVSVRRVVQVVGNPLCCIFFGTLFVLNFPLMKFDDRLPDLLFYGLGILIAWGVGLYVINKSVSEGMNAGDNGDGSVLSPRVTVPVPLTHSVTQHVVHFLQMCCIAAMLWYSTDYMNGTADIFHRISERQIMVALLLLMLLFFDLKELPWKGLIAYAAIACGSGIYYVRGHLVPAEEKEYELHNLITTLSAICVALAIAVLLCFVTTMRKRAKQGQGQGVRLSVFGMISIVLAAFLIAFRHGKMWVVVLIAGYAVTALCFALWKEKDAWMQVLSGGLVLNFLHTVGYCLIFRVYAGYKTSRYAMRFHTVTVTAEYLTIMLCAALVLLLVRMIKVYNTKGSVSFRDCLNEALLQCVFLGLVSAYVIFTLSRTAYLAVVVAGMALLIAAVRLVKEKRVRAAGQMILTVLLSVLLLFPAVFTLQRTLPAMAAHPKTFEVEDTDKRIGGGVNWDHRNFMCVERFYGHFTTKILGMEDLGYDFPEDRYNYDENKEPIYDPYGNPLMTPDSGARRARTQEGYEDSVEQFSNGRITIFKSYLASMNMEGHDTMGATLPDGTVIVHAHNVYLQVAYDFGIVTGIVFALWLVAGLVTGVKRGALLPFGILAGFMVVGLTEWNFHFANPMTIALLLAVMPLYWKEKTKQTI